MSETFGLLGALVLGYLLGSLPSAVLISKILHLPDPRLSGSHNPGATNMLRVGGKKAGLLTFLCDSLKAFIPVSMAAHYANESAALLILVGAFLGHIYPLFLKFKGGKGVATALGGWLALSSPVGLGAMVIWLMTALAFRYSSLAALCAAIGAPFLCLYFVDAKAAAVVGSMTLLLLLKHQDNIKRLLAGTETKIGKSPKI